MHALGEDSMVVAERVGGGFALVGDSASLRMRFAVGQEFALIEQVRTDHGDSRIEQLLDLRPWSNTAVEQP